MFLKPIWFARKMLYRDSHAFYADLPPLGRLLGIDWGTKQIGLALSDVGRCIATPHSVVRRGRWLDVAAAFRALTIEHEITGMVLGYPLNLDGRKTPMTQAVEQFARNLTKSMALPLLFAEERFSSVRAENALLAANLRRESRDEKRDMVAAAIVLQQILDKRL